MGRRIPVTKVLKVLKVLILDDSNDYLRALRGALRQDYEVLTAQTLERAKEFLDVIRASNSDRRAAL